MTRQEFLDTLRRTLNRELSQAEVEENIRYYDSYIREQEAQGREESEVLASLGDPRLIARTILQVDESRDDAWQGRYAGAETVFTENPDGSGYEQRVYGDDPAGQDGWYGQDGEFDSGPRMHTFHVSGWKVAVALIAILVVVCVLVGAVAAVVWKLLPFILVIAAVLWLYHRFFR